MESSTVVTARESEGAAEMRGAADFGRDPKSDNPGIEADEEDEEDEEEERRSGVGRGDAEGIIGICPPSVASESEKLSPNIATIYSEFCENFNIVIRRLKD
jgi:hypothetical protein